MKKYTIPTLEVNNFSVQNIVTTSTPTAMGNWQNESGKVRQSTTIKFSDMNDLKVTL